MKTIAEIFEAYHTPLSEWAVQAGGSCVVVGDFVEIVRSILSQKPGAPVVYLALDDETPRGEHAETFEGGRVDRTLLAVVSYGHSMKIERGEILFKEGPGGVKPLFDVAEEAREVIRGVQLETDEAGAEDAFCNYKGITKFQAEGVVLDALQIKFTVPGQLPAYEYVE